MNYRIESCLQKDDVYVIGEVALGHEGSLGIAHAFIDAIADCGADAVKFQMHIAEEEGTIREKFRVPCFPQDKTRQDYWRRTAFNIEQWNELSCHAQEREIDFICSPFSIKAVEILKEINVAAWKIASGEVTNFPMLSRIAQDNRIILLSTGMSNYNEIDNVVNHLKKTKSQVVLFQCTSEYPCTSESVGFNNIAIIKDRYKLPVGISDHSGMVGTGIAAVAMGAFALETHVTFHKKFFGPDVKASLSLDEFELLIKNIRFVKRAMQNPVDKNVLAEKQSVIRGLFTKSIVAARNLSSDHVLTEDDLACKKPGDGIPSTEIGKMIGKVLRIEKLRDDQIDWKDLYD